MRIDPLRTHSRLALVLLAGLAPVLVACGSSADTGVENPPPAAYEVRGVVRQVKDLGDSGIQISLQHEAIPDFVGIKGDVVGMKSMTMPFTVSDSVDVSSLQPGAKVRFELSVDWNRKQPGLITSMVRLPEETALDFDNSS